MDKHIVRHLIFPLHEKIIGRKTFRYLKELETLQWTSPEELEALRFRKLQDLLIHADKNTLYYKDQFKKAGFDPNTMQKIADIRVLPLLTKKDIRQNLQQMQWRECPGGLYRYNTGGSSGEPLVFYFDRRRQAYDAAARALTHRWWGIDVGDKELYLWGSPVELTKQDLVKSLRDRLTNQLLLSAFDLSPAAIPQFIKKIRKFKPKCIFGYPSSIALFCEMAEEMDLGLEDLGVEVVFCSAEVLYDHQRSVISEYFGGIPVVDGYGSREGGFVSHECEAGSYHVIDPNYVIEYIKDGEPVSPGEDGEIVLTHLDAWGMPFIRYRTGDIARAEGIRCKCGRSFSTMSIIQGRTTDFVVTPDGRWQHGLSVIYIVRDIEGVDEFRIIQEAVDDVRVLIKVEEELYPHDGDGRIMSGIKQRMGNEVRVSVERVDEIPRDASGKYRYVVSKVAGSRDRGPC